jgi:protein-disulfide isomerase
MRSAGRLSVPVNSDDHRLGPEDAPIIVVEYGDYECPYCGAAYPIVNEILRTFGRTLLFVFRNFPLEQVHPHAEAAAEVAEAVGVVGDFWAIHDTLFENQNALESDDLFRYASKVGVGVDELRRELNGRTPAMRVQRDMEGALRSGVGGTPTFFVNGVRYDGSWDFEPFVAYLQSLAT